MKFIVSSSGLLKQLSGISGVVPGNPIIPILENFLFEIGEGRLTVTASDLQTSVTTTLLIEAKEDGKIAIPAKILLETLRNLPEQPVTFTIDEETYGIEISSDNGRYKLAGENATDFPKAPAVKDGYSISIAADILGKAIGNTLFTTGSDELRPAMTGVYIHFGEQGSTFVSTDGHRLSRYKRGDVTSDANTSVLLPKKALNLLKSCLPSDTSPVQIDFNMSNAFFSFGNISLICRLIDERFPDYENVIPTDNDKTLKINRQEFLNSLKRISIYANKTTHQVRLKIVGSDLHISAEDLDFSNEANERLACEFSGEDIEIGFNARFLIEMLNNIDAEEVKFEMSAPHRAGIMVPETQEGGEELLMLVMPVMLNSYAT